MAFSGALTLTDLNDFITPSQACIKPVEQTNPAQAKEGGVASTEIRIDATGSYYEVAADGLSSTQSSRDEAGATAVGKKLEKAQINLNDCLACSGCITSAESVLITLQSHIEVLNFLEANAKVDISSPLFKVPVVSIAPQSLASISAAITAASPSQPVTPRQVLRRVRAFCKDVLGFSHVFDTTFARHIALREHVREFAERRARHERKNESGDAELALPMLASACPGWICYAEKTHSEMLPFIASTKSPQQVMGTLVKNWMGKLWGKLPSEIYHVTVMPCYDKKLEASRQDFFSDIYSTRDVDCVITTGELELMMREKAWDLASPVDGELDGLRLNAKTPATQITPSHVSGLERLLPELLIHEGSSSGSYLYAVIDHVQRTSLDPLILSVHTMRNTDHEEYILHRSPARENDGPGEIVFKGAKCYGFRNLQNLVRKVGRESGVRAGGAAGRLAGRGRRAVGLRRGRREAAEAQPDEPEKVRGYDYVEVMACPGGCVNGGGQLRPAASKQGSTTDAEGYPRDWGASGVVGDGNNIETVTNGPASNEVTQPKWGDKEWTRRVEEAYWLDSRPVLAGLVPDYSSLDCIASSEVSGACSRATECACGAHERDRCTAKGVVAQVHALAEADRLARRVVWDLCYRPAGAARGGSGASPDSQASPGDNASYARWFDGLCGADASSDGMMDVVWPGDAEAEECRKKMLRTQYRAVESEVIGLAVKW